MESAPNEVTALLQRLSSGDKSVIERLMPLVYAELHRRANRYMQQERPDHTLQPTALVHEVYLKLVQQREPTFRNRAHFYAISAQLMRRILIDHARARLTAKRASDLLDHAAMETLAEGWLQLRTDHPEGLLAINDALSELSTLDARQEKVVEMRFFGGLTSEETAEVLGISTRTVEREWSMARAWLYTRLKTPIRAQ